MNRPEPAEDVASLVRLVGARDQTVAVAESLTGGLVCAWLTSVSGASAVVRGAVVAYATEVKVDLLAVERQLLAHGGAVQAPVAAQMAAGVRAALGATWGLATTGVAGPAEQDGQPVGRVYIAVAGPTGTAVRELNLAGDREQIRADATRGVLRLWRERLN